MVLTQEKSCAILPAEAQKKMNWFPEIQSLLHFVQDTQEQ
jgi:hypothetical protein